MLFVVLLFYVIKQKDSNKRIQTKVFKQQQSRILYLNKIFGRKKYTKGMKGLKDWSERV